MTAATRFRALMDELQIVPGSLVYLHTSFSRLLHFDLSPAALIDAVLEHLGPAGTLVMPSFAWHIDKAARPWAGYAQYYRERPVFDVRRTPANIGVIPELYRTYPGVIRSAHFWWSVAARGPLAEELTRDQTDVIHPYSPESAFGRLHARGATILGLGVTLNTTSLAPVVDHALGPRHTQTIFSPGLEEGVVVDRDGREIITRSHWLLPDVVRLIKPSALIAASDALGGSLRRADHDETIQFAYPFAAYYSSGVSSGIAAAARGLRMPWLEQYEVMKPGVSTPDVGSRS